MSVKETLHDLSIRERIIRVVLLMASVAIIVYFLPREGKFRYHFQEGKPWRYGLLTASFDFPVYKSDAVIQYEQDSIMRLYQPYYKMDASVAKNNLKALEEYHSRNRHKISSTDYDYLKEAISAVYKTGVITSDDLEQLNQQGIRQVRIIDNNISKMRSVGVLQTIRQAYESIIDEANSEESRRQIRAFDINNYLGENLAFDSITSKKVRDELLQRVSRTSGIVQSGEKIVDRGEIITHQTYNILRSLEIASEKRSGSARQQSLTLIGQIIFTLLMLGSVMIFLYMFRPWMFMRLRDIQIIFLMITGMVIFCAFFSSFRVVSVYIVPFAIVPIVLCTFLDSRVAYFSHLVTITLCSFIAPFAFEFMILQMIAGITAMFSLKALTQRSQLVKTAIMVLLAYCVTYAAYTLIIEGTWEKMNYQMFINFLISSVLVLFAYLLIYILEKTFGFTSSVTLVELSNINSPLLRRLSEECPGTFQHSLQISNLAAQAAMGIGADVQLVRVGALYHDIGKLSNPQFFTENQIEVNPHDNLPVEDSVQIIKQHVSDGIRLAQKANLPEVLVEFIATHHGESKIKYFYNKWKNEHPDEVADEQLFSYPGPNPYTREQALLMMADCIEAASRSLKGYTDEAISQLVNNIIDSQVAEGLFRDTPLTFRDMETIKTVFIERIKAMYHTRISYPELKKKN